jgi:hypothetical protein
MMQQNEDLLKQFKVNIAGTQLPVTLFFKDK